MTTVAVANQKGGVGKTTTAINLGASLAEVGFTVLLVDMDPQANATSGLGLRTTRDRSIYRVLVDDLPVSEVLLSTNHPRLSLAPSCPELAGAEVELVAMMAREFRLRRALEKLETTPDFILIDCPPSLGLLTINALVAAQGVIVPVQCEYLALEGLGQLMHTMDLVRRNLNADLGLYGMLLTMFDSRTHLSHQVAEEVRQHFPQTFRSIVPRSVRLSEAPSHGLSILAYDGESRGAQAYRELAREILEGRKP